MISSLEAIGNLGIEKHGSKHGGSKANSSKSWTEEDLALLEQEEDNVSYRQRYTVYEEPKIISTRYDAGGEVTGCQNDIVPTGISSQIDRCSRLGTENREQQQEEEAARGIDQIYEKLSRFYEVYPQ